MQRTDASRTLLDLDMFVFFLKEVVHESHSVKCSFSVRTVFVGPVQLWSNIF